MDYRIQCLEFPQSHPLLLSSIACSVLSIGTIASFLLEYGRDCTAAVDVWMLVALTRLLFSLLLRTMLEVIGKYRISTHSFYCIILQRVVDLLDLLAFVLFFIGHLLIFPSIACITTSPLSYSVAVAYIATGYAAVVIPFGLKYFLYIFPPESVEDQLYLQRMYPISSADRQVHFADRARETLQDFSVLPTTDRSDPSYWRDWLASYGCEEIVLTRELLNHRNRVSGDVRDIETGDRSSDDWTCPICLTPFAELSHTSLSAPDTQYEGEDEENDVRKEAQEDPPNDASPHLNSISNPTSSPSNSLIVRYPCSHEHYFHPECLHHWLEVSSRRRSSPLTCPCCRESPSSHNTSIL